MKLVNYLTTSLWFAYFLILALFVAGSLLVNADATIPGNYKAFITRSGSMEPTIMTGDVIIDSLTPQKVKSGVIITFKDEKNRTISHRVIKLTQKKNRTYYTTKGDHNNAPDPNQITDANIIGFYRYRLPYLGIFIVNLRKPAGLFLLILIPTALTLLGDLFQSSDDQPKENQSTTSNEPTMVDQPQEPIEEREEIKSKQVTNETSNETGTEVVIENL